jgi:hypothetical protein
MPLRDGRMGAGIRTMFSMNNTTINLLVATGSFSDKAISV